jgi:hypothetical protein
VVQRRADRVCVLEIAFSLNIAVELPVVVFSADRAAGGREFGAV